MAARNGIRMLYPRVGELLVYADRTRLKQVLLNLLSNAIKYNRPQGTVAVNCEPQGEGRVRIAIQDTGLGLDQTQLASLFQPFNRLGQEAGPQEGTGIGLVVTQRLVQLMGGEIGVQSTPGTGSVFWVELRMAEASPVIVAAPQLALDAEHGSHAATVLCVEDNPASMELVKYVLGMRPNLRLLTATDGLQAVKLAREHRPDLVLMDSNMPLMSGGAAQKILRDDPLTQDIPIIALTANAMPDAVAEGIAAGFFMYLTKPFDVDELLSAVDKALASGRRA
jgi:CheY-like chemotaxis protein/anti-sigma regulatory factor (Ser/Thr protein kinase)